MQTFREANGALGTRSYCSRNTQHGGKVHASESRGCCETSRTLTPVLLLPTLPHRAIFPSRKGV